MDTHEPKEIEQLRDAILGMLYDWGECPVDCDPSCSARKAMDVVGREAFDAYCAKRNAEEA